MVKPLDGISRATPKTIITLPANISSASVVVNQPFVANHIAPAVAANNVAQKWSREDKLLAGLIGAEFGEAVIGGGCAIGVTLGVVEIAKQMGATVTVVDGVAGGVAGVGALCVVGSMFGTLVYCLKSMSK